MTLGRVVGTVVATRKEDRLSGFTLQVVEGLGLDMKPTGAFVVAVDAVGAGAGEIVLTAAGSSARLTEQTLDAPVDAVIMAIVDALETHGEVVYDKARPGVGA
ncbi:MAG: EutN/CcmL family microcompartment protein [Gemmatimonadota bacterium]|jgi:microcompartment protein CcmK/EutM|nr:EutN/CcmL family microcompartment protein [Gemmatimonadota bacterium]MDP6802123.1 EutN/CcmL family microcompartment protein [Gemmatimonadota bacterium]MDP7032058.1 EutN/CcmL family microcompartment protein [Gemmatimonadota bacterium]